VSLGGGERGRKGKKRELPSIWAGKKKPIEGKKAWRYSAEGSPRSPALVAHFGPYSTYLRRDARDGFHHCWNGGRKKRAGVKERREKRKK